MNAEIISPYEYTANQAEVLHLNDLYRRCLLDQKYYSYKLAQYKRWDLISSIITSLATSSAIAGLSFVKDGPGKSAFMILGVLSAVALVVKPFFKALENIERYSKLHFGFTDLFYRIETLLMDIRRNDGINDSHRKVAEDISERLKSLALQEDIIINNLKLLELQDEVDRAIPGKSLWLPQGTGGE